MNILRKLRRFVLVGIAIAGVVSVATPADAAPMWTGCRPHIDPETLEISTLCY